MAQKGGEEVTGEIEAPDGGNQPTLLESKELDNQQNKKEVQTQPCNVLGLDGQQILAGFHSSNNTEKEVVNSSAAPVEEQV